MVQFRVVLALDATGQIVSDNENGGALYYDALFSDKPWQTTALRQADTPDLRALLYHEKATEADRAKCLPVAKDLAAGRTPKPADVQAVKDAKTEADGRPVTAEADAAEGAG